MVSKIRNSKQNILRTAVAITLITIAPSIKAMHLAKTLLKRNIFTEAIKIITANNILLPEDKVLETVSHIIQDETKPILLIHESENLMKEIKQCNRDHVRENWKKLTIENSWHEYYQERAYKNRDHLSKSNMEINREIIDFLKEKDIRAIDLEISGIIQKATTKEPKIEAGQIEKLMKNGIVPIIATSLIYQDGAEKFLNFIRAKELADCLASALIDSSVLTEDDYDYDYDKPQFSDSIMSFVDYKRFIQEL